MTHSRISLEASRMGSELAAKPVNVNAISGVLRRALAAARNLDVTLRNLGALVRCRGHVIDETDLDV